MASRTINKYMNGTDTGWLEMPNANNAWERTGNYNLYYRLCGNILSIQGQIRLTENWPDESNSYYRTIDTMPAGFRPAKSINITCFINSSGNNQRIVSGRITNINSTGGGGAINLTPATNNEPITTNQTIFIQGVGFID